MAWFHSSLKTSKLSPICLQLSVLWWAQMDGDALLLLSRLLHAIHPEVRAAAVFALSICIQVTTNPLSPYCLLAAVTVQFRTVQHLCIDESSSNAPQHARAMHARGTELQSPLQVGKPDIARNGDASPAGAGERARLEKEREIACHLLQVVTLPSLAASPLPGCLQQAPSALPCWPLGVPVHSLFCQAAA